MALTKEGYTRRLVDGELEEAANNLINFSNKCTIKPKFLCVISGMIDHAYKRLDDVYVVPITLLKP